MTALLVLIKDKCLKTEIRAEELVGMSLEHAEWDTERDPPQCQIRAADALVVSSTGDATALSRWCAWPAVAALTLQMLCFTHINLS